MTNTLYYITIPYACFGIEVNINSIVVNTAPIAEWMVGKHINEVKSWIGKKGGKIEKVQ
jgi:hypothetical protein